MISLCFLYQIKIIVNRISSPKVIGMVIKVKFGFSSPDKYAPEVT
jgi:hypothetical protein